MKRFRKMLTVSVMAMTVLAFSVIVSPASAAVASDGDLIKMDGLSSVYYLSGGKRYVFPNEQTYFSWYSDWSGVKTVPASELQSYPLAANVVTRPGTDLVKITTDPTVYAVEPGGVLRSIVSEANAISLWGANWADMVKDVPDSFFVNYTVGDPLTVGTYPVGTLLNPTGTMDIYYFDGTNYRKFNNEASFLANKFQFEHIVTTDKTITAGGAGIAAAESTLIDVSNTGATSVVTTTPVGGSGLSVALSSDTAAAGTIIAGQATASLGSFNLSASADGDITVTNIKMKRVGVSADATLSSVYLYDGNTRLTDAATVSSTIITWNNSAGIITIPAGTTKTITVKSNIASTIGVTSTSGQTVGIAINAAADITAGGATISGSFPVTSNIMSIASADLASVSFNNVTSPASDGEPNPQSDFQLWKNNVSVGTRAVDLHYITFRNIGSVTASDVKDFELYVKGTKVGDTVATMDSNGYITFDLSASPLRMETGTNEIKVLADIVGGSTRTINLSLRQASDVMVVDSEYGANVLVIGVGDTLSDDCSSVDNAGDTTGTFGVHSTCPQTIGTGNLTIVRKTDSPSGNIVVNGSQVTLATFELKAYGEKVKVESLDVAIHASTVTDTAYTLRNGALYADGVQVGSTADIAGDTDANQAYTRFNLGSSLIVTPGTPVTLKVVADVYDNDGTNDAISGATLRADIKTGSSNAQRMTSLGYFSAPGSNVQGNTLTIADGSLTLAKNQSYGDQTVVVPASAVKMGDFTLSTGNTDGVNLTSIIVKFTGTHAFLASDDLSDVYVVYGSDTTNNKNTVLDSASTNTWTINKDMAANTNMNIAVYATLASGADATSTTDTMTTSVEVTGNTLTAATPVATNGTAVLDGQVITASSGGTLTVQLADDTPAASIAVAGTQPDNGSIKLKLTAADEDVYVKELKFRVDTSANDAAIASADLYAGTTTFSKVGVTKTWNADSTNPGYVEWVLSGTDRIEVPKDGTIYVVVKPTYVSSDQGSVSNTTPMLFLDDLEAEGAQVITPSSSTPNLVNDTGIIIKSGGSHTYVDSAVDTNDSVVAADTTLTTNHADTFLPGDIIFIDESNLGKWDVATEELMVVLADNGTGTVTVERGAFGTTAGTYTTGKNIYRLHTDTMTTSAGIRGAATTIVDTKPTIALASDNPNGATTGGSQKVLFKFTVTADNNAGDPAENKVSLTQLDLTTTKSGTTVKNVKIYPEVFDQNGDYDVVATGLSTTKWRFDMDSMPGNLNQVAEGTSKTYVVRGDVGSYTNASNSLEVSIASILSGGDVTWSDGDAATSENWVDQSGASYISGNALTYGASSGTYDNDAPTIDSILVADAGGSADTIESGDTITITFDEMVDPTSINDGLIAGGSAVPGVLATATGGVTGANGTGVITVTNITTFSAGTGLGGDASFTTNLALNTTGTVLTITLGTGDPQTVTGHSWAAGNTIATVTDINGTAMGTGSSPTPTGTF